MPEPLKVIAFLQNMWVRDPDKVRKMIERDTTGELRGRIIEYALFAGCLTGRRLKAALGEEWCERIIWEEASPVITGEAKTAPPPDPTHIHYSLLKHQPDLVICLSQPAEPVIRKLCECWIIVGPHPAARQATVVAQLQNLKVLLELFAERKRAGETPESVMQHQAEFRRD
jgi:hypothetical protein